MIALEMMPTSYLKLVTTPSESLPPQKTVNLAPSVSVSTPTPLGRGGLKKARGGMVLALKSRELKMARLGSTLPRLSTALTKNVCTIEVPISDEPPAIELESFTISSKMLSVLVVYRRLSMPGLSNAQ